MTRVDAPWTDEFVDGLNEYQEAGWMHPYTCGNEHCPAPEKSILVARDYGWVCVYCPYLQTWAHHFTVGTRP